MTILALTFTENKLQISISAFSLIFSIIIFQECWSGLNSAMYKKLNYYLCRTMSEVPVAADDFYELASSLEASTESGNVVVDVEMDEAILDAEDEDEEIQILDTPAPPLSDGHHFCA
jgi:hypothetical protein